MLPNLPMLPTLPMLATLPTEPQPSPTTPTSPPFTRNFLSSSEQPLPTSTTSRVISLKTTTTSLPSIISRTEVVEMVKIISILRTLDEDTNNYLTIGELKNGLSAYFADIVRSVERVVALAGENKGRVAMTDLDRLANRLKGKQEDSKDEDDERLFYRIVDHVPSNCDTGLVDEQGNCWRRRVEVNVDHSYPIKLCYWAGR